MILVINHCLLSVLGNSVTVRGCAPFNKDFFPAAMQKGMAGTYWNGYNKVISLCDFDNCNSGRSLKSLGLASLFVITALNFVF